MAKIKDYFIKSGQTWVHKKTITHQIFIAKRKGDQWQVKVLTERTNVFNGTHTMTSVTIVKNFMLIA